MADYISKVESFQNRGLVSKKDPASLQPGQYQDLVNLSSLQEGALSTVRGTQRINGEHPVIGLSHTIAKLRKSADQASNFRYLGIGEEIFRGAATDLGPFDATMTPPYTPNGAIIDLGADAAQVRWTSLDYATGLSGNPSKYIATNAHAVVVVVDPAAVVPQGIVDTAAAIGPAGSVVTWVSGTKFPATAVGKSIVINTVTYAVAVLTDDQHLILATDAGIQTSVDYAIVNGTVDTAAAIGPAGSIVTWVSGSKFPANSVGKTIVINGVNYVVAVWTDDQHITLLTDAGIQTAVNYTLVETTGRSGMLKDDGTMVPPQFWGINPPTRPIVATIATSGTVTTAAAIGTDGSVVTWTAGLKFPENAAGKDIVIDGVTYTVATFIDNETLMLTGDVATPGSGLAYTIEPDGVVANFDWLYTFRNPVTGLEGNPCAVMIDANQFPDTGSFFTLTLYGTPDPQITTATGDRSIAIYRRGGIFADGLYRLIGYATNTGDYSTTITFTDDVSDDSLVNARILEFDNDAPVSSNLPIPISATVFGTPMTGADSFTITLNPLLSPLGVGDLSTLIRPGTPITIGVGDLQEVAIIEDVSTGLDLTVYVQNAQPTDTPISISYVVNEPCQFTCLAFNSAFWAGDKNNPHVLYKSKTQRIEASPIVNLENGASGNIVVGSPSNPIMNLCEFNGEVVVLNLSSINLIRVWQGVMQAPIETPAKRGLLASFAWCKVGNSIWYLSYDGIYSWEGGQEQKRSEAINPMFLGETVNGILPMDMNPGDGTPGDANNALQYVNFEYHNHEVNIVYRDTGGNTRRLRYSIIYDRWYLRDDGVGIGETGLCAVNAMHLDRDTGTLVLGKYITDSNRTFLEYDDLGSSESWFDIGQDDPGAAGKPIVFRAYGAAYDLGAPAAKKHFGDLVLEVDNTDLTNNPADALQMELFWDFETPPNPSTPNPIYTYTIPTGVGRRALPLPIFDGDELEVGRDARAMGVRLSGSNTHPVTFYSLTINVLPLELQQRGRAYDWDWLDYDYDKLLQVLTIEYDMGQTDGSAVTRTFCVDISSGIAGAMTQTLNVFSFQLSTARGKANFALPHDTVAKMVRIRPLFDADQNLSFMVWKYKFQFDKWPPDIVRATSWENNDSDYDKYYQQVDFDVDTGGVGATVVFQIDGGDSQTLPLFATTPGARHINFTLSPNLRGKQARLLITPGPGGKFQLFTHKFITLPADKGPVVHTFDWDDLGHPWDKRLRTVSFEYELMLPIGGAPVTIQMDTINGIQGSTINTGVQFFTLAGPGRACPVFPINLDTIAKRIRLFPISDTFVFKDWKYSFDKIDYPADIVYFTEFDDLGYPAEKILRELTIDMSTGGVPCSVDVEIDGVRQYNFSMTTTDDDKSRMITMPSRPDELIGKLFRLIFTPGPGGKAQYFKHHWERVVEPPRVFHISSFQQNAGSNGRKLCKRVWAEYTSYEELTVSIYTDNNTFFYSKVLPAHPSRDVETFLLPAANGSVLNKSYLYTIDFDSCDTFKLYKDSCRLEILNLASDTRACWRQFYIWQQIPLPGL